MRRTLRAIVKGIELIGLFGYELVASSLRVAHDVLTPQSLAKPGIVAIPLDVRSDFGITVLANLISLTPGSLALDVTADRQRLFVHVMFIDDLDAVRRAIKNGFERRILEIAE